MLLRSRETLVISTSTSGKIIKTGSYDNCLKRSIYD